MNQREVEQNVLETWCPKAGKLERGTGGHHSSLATWEPSRTPERFTLHWFRGYGEEDSSIAAWVGRHLYEDCQIEKLISSVWHKPGYSGHLLETSGFGLKIGRKIYLMIIEIYHWSSQGYDSDPHTEIRIWRATRREYDRCAALAQNRDQGSDQRKTAWDLIDSDPFDN